MLFQVSRVQMWSEDVRPCERAFKAMHGGPWVVDIKSMEDLMDFYEEVGMQLIIGRTNGTNDITIYDDYLG